jgi:hypothetical protein
MRLERKLKRLAQKGIFQRQSLVVQKKVYLEVLKRMFSIHLPRRRESLWELVKTHPVWGVLLEILLLKSQTSNQITDLGHLKEVEDSVKTLSLEQMINPS